MIKYALILSILSALFPSTVWGQQESGKGEIAGKVVNVTLDSSALAGQKVVLYQYVDNQEVQRENPFAFTDNNGRFVFKNIDINERYAYYPLVIYNGVEYSGILMKPTLPEPQQDSDIYVFESTLSDSAISIVGHHLIIEPGMNDLIIREVLMFVNNDNQTYIGTIPQPNGKNIVLPMEIPVNAKDLQFGGDLMSCCVIVNGNRILDTMEFKPGMRQVSLQYILSYDKTEVFFTKAIVYPTETLDIFAASSIQISEFSNNDGLERSEGTGENLLVKANPIQMQGGTYNHYKKSVLKKGSIIGLIFSNLPDPKRDYNWLAWVILPVIIITVTYYGYVMNHRQRKRIIQAD